MVLTLVTISLLHRFVDKKVWSEAIIAGLFTNLIAVGLIIGLKVLKFTLPIPNYLLIGFIFVASAFLLNFSRRYASRDKKKFPFIVGGLMAALTFVSIMFQVTAFLGVAVS